MGNIGPFEITCVNGKYHPLVWVISKCPKLPFNRVTYLLNR
jgi:hypothetical protein